MSNWMALFWSLIRVSVSVCPQEVAGEPLYMLYRAIKYQVDKGPVDAVTGKAKRTLNDSHLLREDIDYTSMVCVSSLSLSRAISLPLSFILYFSLCISLSHHPLPSFSSSFPLSLSLSISPLLLCL